MSEGRQQSPNGLALRCAVAGCEERVTSEIVIAAVRSRGSDARDLRDAAHEAYHALRAGVRPGKWDRESIHRAVIRGGKAHDLASHEIGARAVEQVVCARLGVDCGSVEHWAHIAWMEAASSRVLLFPPPPWLDDRIREWMTKSAILRMADDIIALDVYVPRRRKVRP